MNTFEQDRETLLSVKSGSFSSRCSREVNYIYCIADVILFEQHVGIILRILIVSFA